MKERKYRYVVTYVGVTDLKVEHLHCTEICTNILYKKNSNELKDLVQILDKNFYEKIVVVNILMLKKGVINEIR